LKARFSIALAACALAAWSYAAAAGDFRFVLIGDRTGAAQPGIYEKIWREAVAEKPAFAVSAGDLIEGGHDATAALEWRAFGELRKPWSAIAFHTAPGNHDVWSPLSEKLYTEHTGHPLHYSFDYGAAHFVFLNNSRSSTLADEEMRFLEQDLAANTARPVKFVIMHQPGWILKVTLRDPDFPLHQLAKKYGVQYVIAGHLHEYMAGTLEGVHYVSLPSAGGHLRAPDNPDEGGFYGYGVAEVRGDGVSVQVKALDGRRFQP
jgi:hypothetical protein